MLDRVAFFKKGGLKASRDPERKIDLTDIDIAEKFKVAVVIL
ncbi:MAG: hypothetical protein ACC631_04000 [Halocynthiibacter sp.]